MRLQDGFAGVTEVEGNKTTWHRQVNFRPESAANVDAGIMTFADSEHVREDGLDGSYLEEWERLPESVGPTWGFRLARELHFPKAPLLCVARLSKEIEHQLCKTVRK